MTTFSWAGRLVPAALRILGRPGVPAGFSEPLPDGDLLSWLGFEPGDAPDEPRLRWSRPAAWPAGRLTVT